MKATMLYVLATAAVMPFNVTADEAHSSGHGPVSDEVVAHQRHALAENTVGRVSGLNHHEILTRPMAVTILFSMQPLHTLR